MADIEIKNLSDVDKTNIVLSGITNIPLIKGDTGPQGPEGPQGPKGDTGDTGPSNILTIGTVQKGDIASATITGESPNQVLNLVLPKGDKGDTGEKGEQGEQGLNGEKGETGAKGENGATFTPKVSEEGIISWTNDKGLENPTPVNIKGPQGIQGPAGVFSENEKTDLLKLIFPIGSTYTTQENTNPSTILGFGTWERFKGMVAVGLDENDADKYFNEIGKTGGEKTHILTEAELPQLSGNINVAYNKYIFENANGIVKRRGKGTTVQSIQMDGSASNEKASEGFTVSFGSGQSHNNMQPYQVVGYMWIRKS